MKSFLFKTIVFLKKPSIIYRFLAIPVAFYAIFSIAIPDIQFNMASGKTVEMSFDQLIKTPKAELPRYLKIKDAVVPSGTYVYERSKKRGTLRGIYYPVYPEQKQSIKISGAKVDSLLKAANVKSSSLQNEADSSVSIPLMQDYSSTEAKLVIHDTHVQESDIDDSTGHYFDSPTFSIEGRNSGDAIPDDIKSLFTEDGIKISNDAILLKKGETVMKTSSAIILSVVALIIGVLGILTFFPTNVLANWAGVSIVSEPAKNEGEASSPENKA
ncbi:hypothetical protein [Emticicia sp. 21SJ11W-3]|uniref:hypothetical protein n=1 Tax=Emticicia sp. 21SJ11W-3 TaxID=2916755 RepID=UPI0020A1D90B|nr:hypothetical protein [Emticicia sp. 21SJ11W-3]UTA67662.1 hypothetical protein MB380_18980 [Emticicia sp. 21SJ11W-3]